MASGAASDDAIALTPAATRAGRRVRILSIDPGARRPGFACVECWWDPEQPDQHWPCMKPLLLMGDPVVSADVPNVKKYGRTKCIDALDAFFLTHGEAIFGFAPDVAVIETQKGVNNRLVDTISMVMYLLCRHARELFPGACKSDMRVTMCPATWKTQGLGVPPGSRFYDARKNATVAKTRELLRDAGFPRTADVVAKDEAVRDISDAFMQAIQYFMHAFPKHTAAKRKRKPKAKTQPKAAVASSKKRDRPSGGGGGGGAARPSKRDRKCAGVVADAAQADLEDAAESDDNVVVVDIGEGMAVQSGLLERMARTKAAISAAEVEVEVMDSQ